ncbi:hypothetical protein BGZ61DRAFT_112947 [Ilyonectria robusta]|uniref:uncharacterized protein n=1 Tax=Ilyonectria robusta TaxID=1079257 RepID=UPI001E8EC215|nr:uncharacterized protein BGZ61DRAFT_112947 [Ilyonectria robusta]KAH8669956.1 hypothetical protein BGZ61DRAFT_112947 [Ilyonectria robusta]
MSVQCLASPARSGRREQANRDNNPAPCLSCESLASGGGGSGFHYLHPAMNSDLSIGLKGATILSWGAMRKDKRGRTCIIRHPSRRLVPSCKPPTRIPAGRTSAEPWSFCALAHNYSASCISSKTLNAPSRGDITSDTQRVRMDWSREPVILISLVATE